MIKNNKCIFFALSIGFVCFCLYFLTSDNTVLAKGSGTIYANNTQLNAEQDVDIPVLIKNNPGFMGFSLIIQYDHEVFQIKNVERGQLLTKGLFDYNNTQKDQGKAEVIFTNTENIENDGELFVVTLNVVSTEAQTSQVSFTLKKEDTFNENWEDVVIETIPLILNVNQTEVSTTVDVTSTDRILEKTKPSSDGGFDSEANNNACASENNNTTGSINSTQSENHRDVLEREQADAEAIVGAIDNVLSAYNLDSFDEIPEELKDEVVSVVSSKLQQVSPESAPVSDNLTIDEQISEYQSMYDFAKKRTESVSENNNEILENYNPSKKLLTITISIAVSLPAIVVVAFLLRKRRKKK